MYYRHYTGKIGTHKLDFSFKEQAELTFCMPDYFVDAANNLLPIELGSINCKQLIVDSLIDAKNKYEQVRLWFSGGKDSRLVLDSAAEFGFTFDEIVIVKYAPTAPLMIFGNLAEVLYDAIPIATEYCKQYPDCNLNVITCNNEYFESIYENPQWYMSKNFFRYVYAEAAQQLSLFEKKVVSNNNSTLNVTGVSWPQIWFNMQLKQWMYYFTDSNFNQIHSTIAPINVLSPKLNSLLLALIASQLNPREYTNKFNGISLNKLKNIIPVFKNIQLAVSDLDQKLAQYQLYNKSIPSNKQRGMDFLHNLMYEVNNVSSFYMYKNTDWHRLETTINSANPISDNFIISISNPGL